MNQKYQVMKQRRIKKFGLEMEQNVWVVFAIVLVIVMIMGMLLLVDKVT